MALPDLTGQNIQDTYNRLLQISSSGELADGTGSLVPTLQITASYAISASHEITYETSSSYAETASMASSNFIVQGDITSSGHISQSGQLYTTAVKIPRVDNGLPAGILTSNKLQFYETSVANQGIVGVDIQTSGTKGTLLIRSGGTGVIYLDGYNDSYINIPGDFGIGTSSPSYKLDVNGTGRFTSHLYTNGNIVGDNATDITNMSDGTFSGTVDATKVTATDVYADRFVTGSIVDSMLMMATASIGVLKGNDATTTGLEVSGYILANHITASGNISASGAIYTNTIFGETTLNINPNSNGPQFAAPYSHTLQVYGGIRAKDDSFFMGKITASGDISSSGQIFGDQWVGNGTVFPDFNTNPQAKIKVNESGVTINQGLTVNSDLIGGVGHITASGNISSSGNIYGTIGTATQGTIDIHSLSGYVANEHLDWTNSVGTIHAGNYTNTMGSGFTVSATTDSNATTITQGDDLMFTAGTGITCETTADGTVTITNTVSDTNTTYTVGELTPAGTYSSSLQALGNVTASGNISASGTIEASSYKGSPIHINSATGFINVNAATMDNATVHLGSSNYGHTDARDYGAAGGTVTVSSPSITDEKQFMGIIVPADLKSVTIRSQGRFQSAHAKMRMCLFTSDRQEGGTPSSITLTKILEVETASSNTWGMFQNMDGTATVDIDAGSIIYVGFGRTEGSTAAKPRVSYTLTGITR